MPPLPPSAKTPLRAMRGKISRLPRQIRDEICTRLEDGEEGHLILSWLNNLPEVKVPLTHQNLSAWRASGYVFWAEEQRKIEATRQRAEYAMSLAAAGGNNISNAAATIVAGSLLELVESLPAPDDEGAEDKLMALCAGISGLVKAQSAMAQVDVAKDGLALKKMRVKQQERALRLAEDKFQAQTVEMFLTWAESSAAREILDSGRSRKDMADSLLALMFGICPEGHNDLLDATTPSTPPTKNV